jgi:hypothetical protein
MNNNRITGRPILPSTYHAIAHPYRLIQSPIPGLERLLLETGIARSFAASSLQPLEQFGLQLDRVGAVVFFGFEVAVGVEAAVIGVR